MGNENVPSHKAGNRSFNLDNHSVLTPQVANGTRVFPNVGGGPARATNILKGRNSTPQKNTYFTANQNPRQTADMNKSHYMMGFNSNTSMNRELHNRRQRIQTRSFGGSSNAVDGVQRPSY